MGETRIIGAVDIGTSKAVALAAELAPDGRFEILGFGESSVADMRKGEILDLQKVGNCVHAALQAAEQKAKADLSDVFLAYSGVHLGGMASTGSANVSGADGRVSSGDIRRASDDANRKELPGGRVYVSHAANAYRLDGEPVANPLGKEGRRLEVDYWHIFGPEERIRDRLNILRSYNLNPVELVFSGIAAARVSASEVERRMGTLIIDIGAGITDFAVYCGGCPCFTGVVPVGGDHFTNDLACALRIGTRNAERLKLSLASCAYPGDVPRDETFWIQGSKNVGDRKLRREAIAQILYARAKELFEVVRAEAGEYAAPELIPGGIVLTGGGSKLAGIEKVAAGVFGVGARRCESIAGVCDELSRPEYSTVLGTLAIGATSRRLAAKPETHGGLFSRLKSLFQTNDE